MTTLRREDDVEQYWTEIIIAVIALIGTGVSALVGGVLTYLGVRRETSTEKAVAMLEQGVALHQIYSEETENIKDYLASQVESLEDELVEVRKQLQYEREARRRLADVVEEHIGPDTLDEISDLPEPLCD
ncbi:MAG: hypothetical protein U5L04_02360 [Trueperaceae bacterium]|nr:hypothetical protein [Trueperaceae bacterium]